MCLFSGGGEIGSEATLRGYDRVIDWISFDKSGERFIYHSKLEKRPMEIQFNFFIPSLFFQPIKRGLFNMSLFLKWECNFRYFLLFTYHLDIKGNGAKPMPLGSQKKASCALRRDDLVDETSPPKKKKKVEDFPY